MSKKLPYDIDGRGYPIVTDPRYRYYQSRWRRDLQEARRIVGRWYYLYGGDLNAEQRRRALRRERKGKVLPPDLRQAEFQRALAKAQNAQARLP